jgi:hypothetical protein
MKTSRRPLLRAAMLALVLALLPGLAHALAKKPFSDLVALDDQRLDQLRGGLDAGLGLVASFGFERVISINGQEVSRQLLVINDLAALLQGALPSLQIIANLGQVVQNGTGNFVGSSETSDARAQALQNAQQSASATAAAAAAGSPSVTAPATSASATSVPTQVASAAANPPPAATSGAAATPSAAPAAAAAPPTAAPPNAATASTPASASAAPAPASTAAPAAAAAAPAAAPATASSTQQLTIQLPNGTVTVNLPNTAAIVQNTVNNATIQINTALSAALNSASLARALTLAGQIRAP